MNHNNQPQQQNISSDILNFLNVLNDSNIDFSNKSLETAVMEIQQTLRDTEKALDTLIMETQQRLDKYTKELKQSKLENKMEKEKSHNYKRILFQSGICTPTIRGMSHTYEYQADIIKLKINQNTFTNLENHKTYSMGTLWGREEFELLNSGKLTLNIKDLLIKNEKNTQETVKFGIKKLDTSIGSIKFDLIFKHLKLDVNREVSNNNNNNVISPDDHFLVWFEYPIIQTPGDYYVETYRLFFTKSQKKRDQKNPTSNVSKKSGFFGEKLKFHYTVVNSSN